MNTPPNTPSKSVVRSSSAVIARLKAGERLRTGYTFNDKAWFDGGDMVTPRILRKLRKAGKIAQDGNGFVRLTNV